MTGQTDKVNYKVGQGRPLGGSKGVVTPPPPPQKKIKAWTPLRYGNNEMLMKRIVLVYKKIKIDP